MSSSPFVQNAATPSSDVGTFDPREWISILLRHKWLMTTVMLIVVGGTVFWTFRQPNIYEGVCSMEYDPSPPRPLGKDFEGLSDQVVNLWMTREWYETQNRVIASRVVAEAVVFKLGLHRNPEFMDVPPEQRKSWKGVTVSQAAKRVQQQITIEQIKDTRIVLIRAKDKNQERASLIANTVADSYIDKTIQDRLGSTISALEWLSTQLDALKKDLETSEFSLHAFKQGNNVLSVSLEDKQNIIANEIQHYSNSLTDVRTKKIELEARLKELQKANNEDPLQVQSALITSHEAIGRLRNEFSDKTIERNGLAVKYGEQHPLLKAVDARLYVLRNQIRGEIDGLISSAESELRATSQIEQGMRKALEKANDAGLALNLREIEYARLTRAKENNAKLYDLLLQRTTETDLTRMLRISNVRILDRSLKPTAPVSPKIQLILTIGVVVGLLSALGCGLLAEKMDRTIKTTEDAERLGLTVLGVLPHIERELRQPKRMYGSRNVVSPVQNAVENKDLIVHSHPKSSIAECCRNIRTNLTFMSPENPLRSILVTSGAPREGKTTVSVSLAIAIAQSGKRVLIIDSDLRRPRLHKVFSVNSTVGITSVLIGELTLEKAVQPTDIPNLFVLPCGPIPPTPSELLHTSKFREIVAETARSFDRVIFDSPPLGAVTDAAVIAPQVDGALLVAKSHRTTRDNIRAAIKQLRDVSANIVGIVINEINPAEQHERYGYYYYQKDYSSTETSEGNKEQLPVTSIN